MAQGFLDAAAEDGLEILGEDDVQFAAIYAMPPRKRPRAIRDLVESRRTADSGRSQADMERIATLTAERDEAVAKLSAPTPEAKGVLAELAAVESHQTPTYAASGAERGVCDVASPGLFGVRLLGLGRRVFLPALFEGTERALQRAFPIDFVEHASGRSARIHFKRDGEAFSWAVFRVAVAGPVQRDIFPLVPITSDCIVEVVQNEREGVISNDSDVAVTYAALGLPLSEHVTEVSRQTQRHSDGDERKNFSWVHHKSSSSLSRSSTTNTSSTLSPLMPWS